MFLVLAGHDVEIGPPGLVLAGAIGVARRRRLVARWRLDQRLARRLGRELLGLGAVAARHHVPQTAGVTELGRAERIIRTLLTFARTGKPDRHPIDLLAEEFAERCRRGEHVSVSDYANQYPQFADQLRELLPPIALMEKLKRRNTSGCDNNSTNCKLGGTSSATFASFGKMPRTRSAFNSGPNLVESAFALIIGHVAEQILAVEFLANARHGSLQALLADK